MSDGRETPQDIIAITRGGMLEADLWSSDAQLDVGSMM